MIFRELYEHLVRHQQLQLPGIGTLRVHRRPAEVDFRNRRVKAPSYSVLLEAEQEHPQDMSRALAASLGLSPDEAIQKFGDFTGWLRNQLEAGAAVSWSGVGLLQRDASGLIRLEPSENNIQVLPDVPAEKIIRQDAEHLVTVGEDSRTSTEMSRLLSRPEANLPRATRWWLAPLVAGVAALAFVAWYFLQQDSAFAAVSNKQRLKLPDSASTYRIIP